MTNNLARMYGIGIMTFILLLSTLVGVPVLPQLSETLGASATEIPIVVSAAWAAAVIAKFFTGILADRYSRRGLILIGALMGSISSNLLWAILYRRDNYLSALFCLCDRSL